MAPGVAILPDMTVDSPRWACGDLAGDQKVPRFPARRRVRCASAVDARRITVSPVRRTGILRVLDGVGAGVEGCWPGDQGARPRISDPAPTDDGRMRRELSGCRDSTSRCRPVEDLDSIPKLLCPNLSSGFLWRPDWLDLKASFPFAYAGQSD